MILIFRWMYTNENIVMHIILHQFLSLKRLRAKRTDWFKFSQITKTLLKVMFNNVDFLTRCLIWVKNSDYRYNTFDTTEWYYHIILNKRYGKSINRFDTLDASLLWSVKSVKIMRRFCMQTLWWYIFATWEESKSTEVKLRRLILCLALGV